MFAFRSKSGKSAALVGCRSLAFAPTVAKTVAIGTLSRDGQFGHCPIVVEPLYKAAVVNAGGGVALPQVVGREHRAYRAW